MNDSNLRKAVIGKKGWLYLHNDSNKIFKQFTGDFTFNNLWSQ